MPRSPPSTQCAPWPYEASAFGHNALTNESAQLIRTHVATLLAESRRAITPLAIEKMFARNQTRKSCVLLRASNGRLLVDPLDTPFLRGNIEIASCYPSKFYNFIRSRMHVAFRLILRAMRRLRLHREMWERPLEVRPRRWRERGLCPDRACLGRAGQKTRSPRSTRLRHRAPSRFV